MKKVLPVFFGLTLAACGGGSDDKSTPTAQEQQTSVNDTTTAVEPAKSEFAPIVGVYDASYEGDKAVAVIDSQGKYHMFDHLNDNKGGNKDCYAPATQELPNYAFNGLSFKYDENLRHFQLQNATPSLAYEINDNNELEYIISDNLTVGGGALSIKSNNQHIVIRKDKLAVSVEDVLSKKCA
ncbi:hypothetical protein [Pseudoalteromonas luteoviolacea]|uniref:hypothetical protein n=1 Tax=Pseudoalteromonas luteoviolacea TaxID=43657 RepID=UPI001B36D451|nr:hypothetical protein [Pseudoalteromonas luteoviolacea]MBQ4837737.1 hypothetical protein [Pseudoalteromonas luteoviolacea]